MVRGGRMPRWIDHYPPRHYCRPVQVAEAREGMDNDDLLGLTAILVVTVVILFILESEGVINLF